MKTYSFYSAMDQSTRKSEQASHSVLYLEFKTNVSRSKMDKLNLRQCVSLAKKLGWIENKDWRTMPLHKDRKIQINIHTHVSKHDCETCSGTWNEIYTLTGDLGEFESGEDAHCYGTKDGIYDEVINHIFEQLIEDGIPVKIPPTDEYEILKKEVDWESYHTGIDAGIYNWYDIFPEDVTAIKRLEFEIDNFYSDGWQNQLTNNNVVLTFSNTEDEDYEDDE